MFLRLGCLAQCPLRVLVLWILISMCFVFYVHGFISYGDILCITSSCWFIYGIDVLRCVISFAFTIGFNGFTNIVVI